MRIPGKRPPSSPPSSLAAALRFAVMGLTVLAVKPRLKHLFPGRTPSSPPTPAELTARWEQHEKGVPLNIGIKTGTRHGLIVVDIDSVAGLAVAEMTFPEPLCRTQRSVRGKERWFYSPPDGDPVPTVRKWRGHDIDIIADGGYIVAPGSVLADGDVIEEIGPNGGLWTADALAKLPRFDRAWLDSIDEHDVVVMARFRGGFPDQWRLMEASARVFSRVKHSGNKMSFCCPFHDDARPSAALFKEGWFHCASCGVSEPAQRWTKRPEVAHLHLDTFVVPFAVTKPTMDDTQFRVPRLLIEVSALMRGDVAGSLAKNFVQRGDGHVDGPDHLSDSVLAVLWAVVASARAVEEYAGGILVTAGQLADALGWTSSSTRAGVVLALRTLATVRVSMKAFVKDAPSVGPLIEMRARRVRLHPALVASLNARGKLWAPVSRAVLRLSHRARMVASEAARRALEAPHPAPLQQLARGCGVWNAERAWKQRGAYLRVWREELPDNNPAAHLEWRDGEWVVVVGPAGFRPSVVDGGRVPPSVDGGEKGILPSAGDGGEAPSTGVVSPSVVDGVAVPVVDDDRETASTPDADSSGHGDLGPENGREVMPLADPVRDQGEPRPAAPAAPNADPTPQAPGRFPGKRPPRLVVVPIELSPAEPVEQPIAVSLRGPYKRPSRPG